MYEKNRRDARRRARMNHRMVVELTGFHMRRETTRLAIGMAASIIGAAHFALDSCSPIERSQSNLDPIRDQAGSDSKRRERSP